VIDILSPDGIALIEHTARCRTLLAFDFDGTLAPLVSDYREAAMRDTTRALFRMVAILYPSAVISGRDRGDLLRRLTKIPLVEAVGNHGAEDGALPDPRLVRQVSAWANALRSAFADQPEIEVEQKAASLAVHYRRAPDPVVAHSRALAAAQALPGARVFGGEAAVNVAPPGVPDKGAALEDMARRLGTSSVVFVGDDITDEDAFRSPAVTLSIRVGAAPESAARCCLPCQSQIEALLRAFVRARAHSAGLGERWIDLCGTPKPR